MAREYARVKVAIWADSDFRLLTDTAQALYFRLLSSPTMSLCGVADWRPKRIAALTAGMTEEGVYEAADELRAAGYVFADDDTEEVLVRSFVRHDGLIKTPNIAAAMAKDFAGVASATLRGIIVHELQRLHADEPGMKGWATASALLSEPSIDPSQMPSPKASGKASGKASTDPSGNESHIPQPASLNQQPAATQHRVNAPGKPVALVLADDRFDEWYEIYPRKRGKIAARKAWAKAMKITTGEACIEALHRQMAGLLSQQPEFRPHPATWLNEGRWDDEVASQPADQPTEGWWNAR